LTVASLRTGIPALGFVLDTNVISELMRPQPHPGVVQRYLAHQAQVALPAPIWHELNYGCLRLPAGRRRSALQDFLNHVVGNLPKLAYDAAAALVHAQLRVQADAKGRVLPMLDSQIAAIAITRGLTLVTRKTRDFDGLADLRLANWFED